jgi:acyl-CoA thioesterase FadM
MTSDFLSSAREGDWLEARVHLNRVGRRLAYAECHLWVGERHILKSSAVFAMVERPVPPAAEGGDETRFMQAQPDGQGPARGDTLLDG